MPFSRSVYYASVYFFILVIFDAFLSLPEGLGRRGKTFFGHTGNGRRTAGPRVSCPLQGNQKALAWEKVMGPEEWDAVCPFSGSNTRVIIEGRRHAAHL